MAEIPSDIASSAAQAGFQARQTAKERDAQRAGGRDLAERQVRAVDEAGNTVDTEDGDTAVFTDAEGAGSQGRPFEEEAEGSEETAADVTDDDEGIGDSHLDISA